MICVSKLTNWASSALPLSFSSSRAQTYSFLLGQGFDTELCFQSHPPPLRFIVCVCMHVCTTCVSGVLLRSQKKAFNSLELELWMVASHHMGARTRTWVPCKE